MKKFLLSVTLLSIYQGLAAQSSFTITDASGNDVTGSTVTLWVSDSVTDTRTWTMHINNPNSVNMKVRKTNLQLNDPGATTWFCTDINCYSSATSLSLAFSEPSGGTSVLTTDFNANYQPGVTRVRYAMLNLSNANDTSYFEIDYNMAIGGGLGIHTNNSFKPVVSNPSPNPASSSFMMNYKMGNQNSADAKFAIYNMLGEKMMESEIADAEGTIRMDVSSLDPGVYFCILESQGKALATRRLVVAH
ncbi:MAG: T9SS type A sorting domain-containing protein [Bacteroidetes bacterium]|nr:T9SS type A sorting domain-containing protein [Bacteroidota bacterium]